MGIGQSKSNRGNHQTHYPYGAPAPAYAPTYPPPHQPFIPGYGPVGFPQPSYPQPPHGYMTTGTYGQGSHLPPPQLSWLPQDRYRKRRSKRAHSERFAGAVNGGQPEVQTRRMRSDSRRTGNPAPVAPQRSTAPRDDDGPSRRVLTPFVPPYAGDEDEDEDSVESPTADLHRGPSQRSHVRYPTPPPIDGHIEHVLQPMEPASSAAFGPTGPRNQTPLRNPLPPPPRDLYEMTPYKSLLSLPKTTALLTASYGPQYATVTRGEATEPVVQPQPSVKRKKSGKGLFRAFSKRDNGKRNINKEPEPPKTYYIPVFVSPKDQQQTITQQTSQIQPDLQRSMSRQSRRPPSIQIPQNPVSGPLSTETSGLATGESLSPQSQSSNGKFPIPPIPSSPPAVRFNQKSVTFAAFLNHSPHRILYHGHMYPSALHLHEALRFLEHRPDIAAQIRETDLEHVYPLSATYQQFQRPDWNEKYIEFMDEVMFTKMTQHPDLRSRLLGTGDARIIYADPQDDYWGTGPRGDGQNMLGQALVRVRERLRTEIM